MYSGCRRCLARFGFVFFYGDLLILSWKLQLRVNFIPIGLYLFIFCLLSGSTFFSELDPVPLICYSMLFLLSKSVPLNALSSSFERPSEFVLRCETWQC